MPSTANTLGTGFLWLRGLIFSDVATSVAMGTRGGTAITAELGLRVTLNPSFKCLR